MSSRDRCHVSLIFLYKCCRWLHVQMVSGCSRVFVQCTCRKCEHVITVRVVSWPNKWLFKVSLIGGPPSVLDFQCLAQALGLVQKIPRSPKAQVCTWKRFSEKHWITSLARLTLKMLVALTRPSVMARVVTSHVQLQYNV